MHYLPQCDYVYVLAHGTIQTHGTYQELVAQNFNFAELKSHVEDELYDRFYRLFVFSTDDTLTYILCFGVSLSVLLRRLR